MTSRSASTRAPAPHAPITQAEGVQATATQAEVAQTGLTQPASAQPPFAQPPFAQPRLVRYLEVDARKVVFNAWYLAWFDDAMTAFLEHRGLPYPSMLDAGYDVQLVRSEVDWRSGVRFQDVVEVAVAPARIGRTSFALDFQVRRGGEVTCAGRSVYVVIATDGSGKREIPPLIRTALGEPAPLR